MKEYFLKCIHCGFIINDDLAYKCPACGHVLEVHYNITPELLELDDKEKGIFRYRKLLPELPGMSMISLQEGDTPVYHTEALGNMMGLPQLFAKHEGLNPSGSFKDRAMALALNRANTLGKKKILLASAGNAGASASAYAARLGMKAVAVIPMKAPESKILQALAYGARVVKVPGDYSLSFRIARELALRYDFYNVTTTYLNPYLVEGYKTAAYEIAEQMPKLPDWIFVPIGAGPFLAGIGKGFLDLYRAGKIDKLPRLAGVQAENCAPIETAYRYNQKVKGLEKHPFSIASGIDDAMMDYEDEGDVTIAWVKKTGGTVIAVSEEELVNSVLQLAKHEGIYAEPAAASGVAAAKRLLQEEKIKASDTVLLMLTGHGLKNPIANVGSGSVQVMENEEKLKRFIEEIEEE